MIARSHPLAGCDPGKARPLFGPHFSQSVKWDDHTIADLTGWLWGSNRRTYVKPHFCANAKCRPCVVDPGKRENLFRVC